MLNTKYAGGDATKEDHGPVANFDHSNLITSSIEPKKTIQIKSQTRYK